MSDFFATKTPIVVFDTEFTTWEGAMARGWSGDHEHRELVQIAAQKIDMQTQAVLDTFECFVRPQINPELSEYFVNLTGITQAQIEQNGVPFAQMLESFLAWSDGCMKYSYSMRETDYSDADVLQENITLSAPEQVLRREEFENLYFVFQSGGVDTTLYNSGKLYQAFGIDLSGHEHNAMFDVTSLVQSLYALKQRQVSGTD